MNNTSSGLPFPGAEVVGVTQSQEDSGSMSCLPTGTSGQGPATLTSSLNPRVAWVTCLGRAGQGQEFGP